MGDNQRAMNVRFGADASGVSKEVAQYRQVLAGLNTSLTETKQKIADTNTELKKLQKEEKELAAAMKDGGTKEQQAQMQQLKDKIAQTTANLGQLRAVEAEIKADIRNTTSELQKQKAGLDDNTKSTGALEKALGKLGTTAKAFISIYGAKKLWDVLIGSNAEMEQYQTSFEVMLGDAEKAKQMIVDLRELAAKTPLAMSDVISNGTLLMNYGVADSNIIGTLTKLGDLASGNAEKLNRVSLAYGQMLAKGKVTGEELRQMTEAGVPLQDALAKSIGVTGEEFSKMVSAGKVGIDDLNKAIDSLTTGDGKFAGMMEKQSQTMNGMLSTLKDNVSEFLRQVGEGAFGEAKDVLADFSKQLKQWEEDGTLDEWAKSLGTTITDIVKLLKGAIEIVFEFKDEIIAAFAGKAVYSIGSSFLPACKKVVKGLKDITTGAKSSAAAMNVYALAAAAVVAVMVEMYQRVQETNSVIQEYRDTMESLDKAGNENINRTKAEMSILESKGKRYEELRTAAELTAAEEAELKSLAGELQEILGDNVTVIDEKTKAYNDLTDALGDYINKQTEAAQKEAAYNMLVEAETQKMSAEQRIKKLTEGNEELFAAIADDPYFKTVYGTDTGRGLLAAGGAVSIDPVGITGTGLTTDKIGEFFQLKEIIADATEQAKNATNVLGDFERAEYEAGKTADDTSDKVKNFTEEIEDEIDAIEELNGMLDTLSSAYQEQQENGQLSYKTIMDLIDAGYAQCLQIDNETGAVKLNTEAYRDLAKAKIEARMAEITQENAQVEVLRSEYRDKINAAGKNRDWTGITSLGREEEEKLAELGVDVNVNTAELAALQQILDNLDGYMSGGSKYNPYAKEAAKAVKEVKEETEKAVDSIKELNSMMDSLSSAYQEQAENGQLSYKTIMELTQAGYAQCLQIDQETGAVTLNTKAYRALAEAKIKARMVEISQGEMTAEVKTELAALQQMLGNLDGYMSGGSKYNPYAKDTSKTDEYNAAYEAYKTEADKKLQLINDELAAKKKLRDKTIEYLDDEIRKRKELNEDDDMQERIDKVLAQLKYAQLDEFSRGQLEKELKNLQEEQEEIQWQRGIQAQKDEANAAYAEAEENAAKAQEQITQAVNTVKQIMENLANGITNISNIINNNVNTVNTTQNIELASQALTMAQITKAVKDALIGTIIIR